MLNIFELNNVCRAYLQSAIGCRWDPGHFGCIMCTLLLCCQTYFVLNSSKCVRSIFAICYRLWMGPRTLWLHYVHTMHTAIWAQIAQSADTHLHSTLSRSLVAICANNAHCSCATKHILCSFYSSSSSSKAMM